MLAPLLLPYTWFAGLLALVAEGAARRTRGRSDQALHLTRPAGNSLLERVAGWGGRIKALGREPRRQVSLGFGEEKATDR